jgi:cytochrome c oxidase cbb3-type subunit II
LSILDKHGVIERNASLLLVGSLVVVCIGGIVEITPLFYFQNTIEKVEGMRPYSPLELMGRDIYVREGCYVCHSQMIRPFRDEVERYGHYSLAAESMYDHPFQWGSKRTGPDLARVGGRYSNEWQVQHLADPRSVVPESIMPTYAFLANATLDYDTIGGMLQANATVGVSRGSLHARDDRRRNGRPDRPGDAGCRHDRYSRALPQGGDRRFRRGSHAGHGDGRLGGLPPDARHPGRLLHL